MQQTSIVIPNLNGASLLRQCLYSIKEHTSELPVEVIVVDNGSTDESLEVCRQMKASFLSLPFNRGFPAACNIGLKMASGDALMLLNNDVIATPNWLSNLLRCLYSDDRIGMVGPVTNYASGKQMVDTPFDTFEKAMLAENVPDSSKWQEMKRLVGFCLLMRRKVVQEIGSLDERFSPGHYEDDDYCYRARLAGYRLMMAGDTFVYHHGSASFRKEGEERLKALIQTNYDKFIAKWGVDPHQFI